MKPARTATATLLAAVALAVISGFALLPTGGEAPAEKVAQSTSAILEERAA